MFNAFHLLVALFLQRRKADNARCYSSHYVSVHMADCDSIFDLPFFIGTLLPNTGRPYYVAECFNSVEESANYEEACHCKDKGEEGPAMFYLWRLNRVWLHTCQ